MKKLPILAITRTVLITLSLLALSLQVVQASGITTVFINEIHYDNTGGDSGEGVEIAGPAGTDLAGWSIVPYNGNNGETYSPTSISGVLTNEQGGFGTAFFPISGMQNGAPDGLALIDTNGTVIQFLSYEGSFTATNGPANGLTSFDIGVAESSSTPVGDSLQLMGSGIYYEEFSWSVPVANTFDAPNTNQTFLGEEPPPTDPVINEFVANHTGSDTGAFIEVFGDPSTDYSAFTVLEIEGDSGAGIIDAVLPITTTDANGYWTDPEDMENGTIVILLVENFSGNSGDDLDTDDDGTLDLMPWSRIVDSVAAFDGGASDQTYGATVLAANFDGQPFSVGGASRIPNGTDTDSSSDWVRNDFDGVGLPALDPGTPEEGEALNTPGAENMAVPGEVDIDIVINEILQNPSAVADGSGEWIELYNAGASPVDINGWMISDNDSDSHVISNGGPLLVPAGGYLLLGNNVDSGTNGGVTVAYTYGGSWFLSNGADELVLTDATQTEIDRVEYDGGPGFPDPTGASMALINPALDNNVGGNWCESATPFGAGDLGTPGAANDCPGGEYPEVYINELRVNKADAEADFFEIQGAPGTSLDGLTYIVLSGEFEPGNVDFAFGLDGVSIPADGFFVAGGSNTASEYGITPDLSIEFDFFGSPSTHLIVSGFDGFGQPQNDGGGAGGIVLDLDTDNDGTLDFIPWEAIVDSVSVIDGDATPDFSYSPVVVGPDGLFTPAGTYRCGDAPTGTFDNNQLAYGSLEGTPGLSNDSLCVLPITLIHDIQGSGLASPMDGAVVAIEGIVVGDFQDGPGGTNGDLNGFWVQEEDADADTDALTSEGIYVYEGSSPAVDVNIGDLVRVEGTVDEFFELTEITSVTLVNVISSSNPLPAATDVTLPVASLDDFERFEGMYVTFPQDLFITEVFDFDRHNQVALASVRANNPTADNEPGQDAIDATNAYSLDRILLDDGRGTQNPDPALHPDGTVFDLTNLFRSGDTLGSVTGVMEFAFGQYRVQPTQGAIHTEVNPRPAKPDDVGGSLKVAAFNVLNYFTTLDEGDNVCGPLGEGCRGADNAEEFTRQRDKIISALLTMDADIVGLIEIENHAADVPTADLVSGLNDIAGAGTWDYIPTGAIGTSPIRQALIFKPAKATPDGAFAILDSTVDPTFNDGRNRPVLAQTFRDNATTGRFTVAVNHLKSKGADCNDIGDPDTGDGSGNCNITRTSAAQALVNWLAGDPTSSGDDDFLIIGDLNAYDREDPIDALIAGGYTDLVDTFVGNGGYSFLFTGTGYLDYALAGTNLLGEVTGTTVWNINADESDLIDYNTDSKQDPQDDIYFVDPFRASDHDPVLLGLDLVPVADLAITKTDSTDTVVPGEQVVYEIVVSNAGPDSDPAAVMTDTFAAPLTCTYTSVAADGATGNTASGAGDLSETLSLPAGSSVTYTATCAIDPATQNGILTNTAEVASGAYDPNLDDNQSEQTAALVRQSDILISGLVSPQVVIAGRELTFTLTATNDGPSNAATMYVSNQLPPYTTFVSAEPSAGGNCTKPAVGATGTVNCTWDTDTAPGGAHSLVLVVTVDPLAPNEWVIDDVATTGSDSQDPDATVNSTTVQATVVTEAYWNVTMFWTDGGEDSMNVTLACDGISPVSAVVTPGVPTTLTATGWASGDTYCQVIEDTPAGTAVDYLIDCEVADVVSNTTYICEIYNTNIQGIPTLNQLGIAILTLLMLSIGLIGFRRFS